MKVVIGENKGEKELYCLAQVLTRLRNKKKFSQERLAEKSGLHEKHIGRIERGECYPTMRSIFLLCNALEMKVSSFMCLVELEMKRKK